MKKCTWCGKEYADDAVRCAVDGQALSGEAELSEGERPAEQADPIWRPQLLNLLQVEGAFARVEGYLRPDWKKIREVIERRSQQKTEASPGRKLRCSGQSNFEMI